MRMEVNNFSTNRLLLSSYPVPLSVLLTSCCCFFGSLMGQSPLLLKAHLLKTGLSDPESHGSVSSVVQGSFAGDRPPSDPESHGSFRLSLICCMRLTCLRRASRSLMGQSPLLCKAHLLETGFPLIQSRMGQSDSDSVSSVV